MKIGSRIEHEAKMLSKLDHPNIIILFEYDLEAKVPYLVTAYFDGKKHLAQSHKSTVSQANNLLLDICEAMSYCISKGVNIHDVEILISSGYEVRLIDFGSTSVIRRISEIKKALSSIQEKLEQCEGSILCSPLRRKPKQSFKINMYRFTTFKSLTNSITVYKSY